MSASRVLRVQQLTFRLKGAFYKTTVIPAKLYGSECSAMKKQQPIGWVAKMMMITLMSGKTRKYRIKMKILDII